MKILVTGGAGFIGSHLCERLSKDHEVYSLDNYFTGSDLNHVYNVTYIKGNTKDIETLVNFSPDMVYHLGEYSRVEQSFEDIDLIYEYNKIGTFSVLEFVRKHNCKLVYAGSSVKFGDIGRNSSPYAWSKSSNTDLIKAYAEWFNLNYAIAYFYNVYGEREISSGKYATLIGIFKEKTKLGEPLPVVSPGTQLRNFTHVDDTVNGLILVGELGYGDDYGIGSDDEFTVVQVAQMFGGNIDIIAGRRGNRASAKSITEKTKQLGWSAKKSLKDHIHDFKRSIE